VGRVSVEEFLLGRETGQGSGGRFGSDWVDVLRDIPLFKPLSKRHVRRIANLARPHRFAEGTAIVRKGERGETFFLIIDGEATVTLPRRKSIALGAGDWFGELALLDGNPRSATVTARTPVLTMRIARRPFLKLIGKDSELTLGLLKGMTERLRALSGPVP
jgi:CRP-like cAMP-binding protein